MALITYENKVALNENPSIADINKVKASDMNEIKSVVNGLIVNTQNTGTTNTYSCEYVNGLQEKGTANINTYTNTDQTASGVASKTLSNSSSTITTKGGKVLIIANANCYNTGAGYFFNVGVKIGENNYIIGQSNQTSDKPVVGSKIIDLEAGTYNTSMFINGTDGNSAIKVPGYSGYSYSIVEL